MSVDHLSVIARAMAPFAVTMSRSRASQAGMTLSSSGKAGGSGRDMCRQELGFWSVLIELSDTEKEREICLSFILN